MNYAISAYPLSRVFQKQLEEVIGTPIQYLVLGEMRKLSPLKLLRKLRSLNSEYLFLSVDEANGKILLPVLSILAALSTARTIEIVYPDLQRKKITKLQASLAIAGFISGTFSCYFALWRCKRQLGKLLSSKRMNVSLNTLPTVLYINANLWFGVKAGGSIGHITGVINALSRQSYDLYYAAIENKGLFESQVSFNAITPPKTFGLPEELNYYRFNLEIIRQLKKRYELSSIKFIYQRLSIANYVGVILSRHLRIPLIIEYNGSEAWIAKNWGRPLRFHEQAVMAENVCLQHAHLIVTISTVLRDELIGRGIEPEKIIYYPNCIDPKIFDPSKFEPKTCSEIRKQYNISNNAIVLTFIGTFGIWHGADILAQAIRKLIDQDEAWLVNHKVHFLLVGDGVKMPEVKAILQEDRYTPYITLTGLIPQQEAPGYLAASDILLSPHIPNPDGSRFFGSPTKLFEYMAMGKAILASDLEQIGEILKNSLRVNNLPQLSSPESSTELAVLCSPGNIDELVTGIRFLVEQPTWRTKFGNNARKEALSKYTWDKHVNVFLQKLEQKFWKKSTKWS